MRLRWKRTVRDTGGSQIAEAALVMPIVFLLFLGIFWFGRAFNIYATINHAAREAARLAATSSCALCGNVDYSTVSADPIANVVSNALQASKLDPAQVSSITPSFCSCGTVNCGATVSCATNLSAGQPKICIQFDVQLNPQATTPGSCGVAVSFRYPYQFYLPFTSLNQQQIYLSTQVEAEGEQ
jgi:Flp pilus assembly protein TadG